MKTTNQQKANITKRHKDELGMDIPENFFSKSKEDILNKVITNETPKQKVFWLKPLIAYPIAASIVLAITLTFWTLRNNENITNDITNIEEVPQFSSDLLEDDFLVTSLIIPEGQIEDYLDHYIANNIILEAELSEQELENIFINSLFVEDSLLNNYINESFIENLII
jgi:hypothetical protein